MVLDCGEGSLRDDGGKSMGFVPYHEEEWWEQEDGMGRSGGRDGWVLALCCWHNAHLQT